MPLIDHTLTDKQKVFADAFLLHGNRELAAQQAGYKHPRQHGTNLINSTTIKRYFKQMAKSMLDEASPGAVKTLVEIANDPKANNMARLKAADLILSKAGVDSAKRTEIDIEIKDNRSRDELLLAAQAVIERRPELIEGMFKTI